MGRNEWCSHRHSIMHSYPLQLSAHGSSCNMLGRALVDDLCLLNYRTVPVLPYILSEMTPITLLENCGRTAVTSSAEVLWVLIPTFENLWYGIWEPTGVCRLLNRGPCRMGANNKPIFKCWEICCFPILFNSSQKALLHFNYTSILTTCNPRHNKKFAYFISSTHSYRNLNGF